jgi:hypothetical protein
MCETLFARTPRIGSRAPLNSKWLEVLIVSHQSIVFLRSISASSRAAVAQCGMKGSAKRLQTSETEYRKTELQKIFGVFDLDGSGDIEVSELLQLGDGKKESRHHVIVSSGWWSYQTGRFPGGARHAETTSALHSALASTLQVTDRLQGVGLPPAGISGKASTYSRWPQSGQEGCREH